MQIRTRTISLLTVLALALAACGGDGGDDDPGPPVAQPSAGVGGADATDAATTGATGETGQGDPESAGGEVPDPCTLVSPTDLTELLGADPGTGSVQAGDPDQRKVCFYGSGLVLAVEVAENWEASIELLRASELGSVEEVPGVGEAAVWQDLGGGAGQFVVLGPDYFVGVTVATGGREAAREVATAMLAAI